MSKIFIYSIPRPTATNLSEMRDNISGKPLKKVKMGQCKDTIQALYSPKLGGLANYISYTPWTENGVAVTDDKGQPLMLQDKLEQKWNKPKGYFTNAPWVAGSSVKPDDLTYFQTKKVKLSDGATVLDLNNMEDELSYYICLGSQYVANSEREWLSHKWPKATHYIALENESDEIKYNKNEIRSRAFASLHSKELTLPIKRKLVILLELSGSRNSLTELQIQNLLFEYIDKSAFTPGSNIDKFNELYKMLQTPKGIEEFEARFILRQSIDLRIIVEKQGTYTWIRPDGPMVIGDKLSEAIEFILNPKKSSLIEDLLLEIEQKLK